MDESERHGGDGKCAVHGAPPLVGEAQPASEQGDAHQGDEGDRGRQREAGPPGRGRHVEQAESVRPWSRTG